MSILSAEELVRSSKNKSKLVKSLLSHIDAITKELQAANDLIGGNVHPLEVEVSLLRNKLNQANDLLSKTCGPKALEDLREQCRRAEKRLGEAEKTINKLLEALKYGSISSQEKSRLIQRTYKWLAGANTFKS